MRRQNLPPPPSFLVANKDRSENNVDLKYLEDSHNIITILRPLLGPPKVAPLPRSSPLICEAADHSIKVSMPTYMLCACACLYYVTSLSFNKVP